MRAKCLNVGRYGLTLGKEYDVLVDRDGDIHFSGDDGVVDWANPDNFELLPDEPDAPKSDWMRSQKDVKRYFNFNLGIMVEFEMLSTHYAQVNLIRAIGADADSFASLCGYDWSDK